jgi:hypothetical protein
VRWLEDTLGDLRFAFRAFRKAPAFTITVVAALAFCIGLNAAISQSLTQFFSVRFSSPIRAA